MVGPILSFLSSHAEGVTISLRAVPRASKVGPRGIKGDQIKWGINAPATDGRANEELIIEIARFFKVKRADVEFLSGESSRDKVVLVRGVDVGVAAMRFKNTQGKA